MTSHLDLLRQLSDANRHLNDRDVDFASSMMRGCQKYGRFSDGQLPHVHKLIAKAAAIVAGKTTDKRSKPEALDLTVVTAMFDKARAKGLKRVKMGFVDEKGREFRVSPAGPASKNPGFLYVKSSDDGYLGKIAPDGDFQGAWGVEDGKVMHAQAALVRFCQDPVKAATVYAKETGCCMFCCAELTDARSVAMSYGPICAGNYGLPWGEKKSKAWTAPESVEDQLFHEQSAFDERGDWTDADWRGGL